MRQEFLAILGRRASPPRSFLTSRSLLSFCPCLGLNRLRLQCILRDQKGTLRLALNLTPCLPDLVVARERCLEVPRKLLETDRRLVGPQ
jgi:hypothetical protein